MRARDREMAVDKGLRHWCCVPPMASRSVLLSMLALSAGCAEEQTVVIADGATMDAGASDLGRNDVPTAEWSFPTFDVPRDTTVPSTDAARDAVVDGASPDANPDAGPRRCTVTPAAEPFRNPSLRLHWRATMGTPFAGADQVCSTPVVADIVPSAPDSPVVPEVAFMTFSCAASYAQAVLRVVSGAAPHRLLWSQNGFGAVNTETAANGLRWDGHIAVGDLDGRTNNGLEVVAVTARFGLVAYGSNGTVYWRSAEPLAGMMGANPSVNIADLEGDGVPEVIAGGAVVNGRTGATLWQATTRGTNGQGPLSVVVDLDDDGRLEVITGSTVYESNGQRRFSAGMGEGFAAVGDILNASNQSGTDGVPEVAVMTSGTLSVLDRRTGVTRWSAPLQGATALGGAPTVADFDGDGQAEIGVAGGNRYTLFDPGCTAAGGDCLARGVRWAAVTDDMSSNVTSSTVFDFNGDGASEVVYNDEERFMVLDGRTGRVVFSDWNPSQTRTEQAIVADADGDSQADIIFGANECVDFAGDTIPMSLRATQRLPGLQIWSSGDGSWVAARPIWNEHGYHIDNLNDDGSVPRRETPSWRTHNTFRLNRARDRVLLAPDLAGAPDAPACVETRARVCVTVRNEGDAPVGMVSVGLYDNDPAMGGQRIAMGMTTRVLAPTQSERVCAEIPAPQRATRVWVRVDDGSAARECDEADNVTQVTVNCGPG